MKSFREYIVDLQEITISPNYNQRGVFNPFYEFKNQRLVDSKVSSELKKQKISVGRTEIKYECVESSISGGNIVDLGIWRIRPNHGYLFRVHLGNTKTKLYFRAPKLAISGHYGMVTRKNSTASSNINELMTLYFMIHRDFDLNNVENFIESIYKISKNTPEKSTGLKKGEGIDLTYSDLTSLFDSNQTNERDIKIGYYNSTAVIDDIGASTKVKNYYWVPRQKPANIHPKNPSDIILELPNKKFIGYSNKIIKGNKDDTSKVNTSVTAFYSKLATHDTTQLISIQDGINSSWKKTKSLFKRRNPTAKKAIKELDEFNIENEEFSESSSRSSFANFARIFARYKLNFYGEDFYHPFRNYFIKFMSDHLAAKTENITYLLKTMGTYVLSDQDLNFTPCPYKLLIGTERGSTATEVSDNENYKELMIDIEDNKVKSLTSNYDGNSQSFTVNFVYNGKTIIIPITLRTRASSGWSGKSLYFACKGITII